MKLKALRVEGYGNARVYVGPDGAEVKITGETAAILIGLESETAPLEFGDKDFGGSIYVKGKARVLAEAAPI